MSPRQQIKQLKASLSEVELRAKLLSFQVEFQEAMLGEQRKKIDHLNAKVSSLSHQADVDQETIEIFRELLERTISKYANAEVCRKDTIYRLSNSTIVNGCNGAAQRENT